MSMTVVSTRKTSAFFYFRLSLHVLTAQRRYGALVFGSNAYIPPVTPKQQQQQLPGSDGTSAINTPPPKTDIPMISVDTPDGTAVAPKEAPPTTKSTSPVPSTSSVNKVGQTRAPQSSWQ